MVPLVRRRSRRNSFRPRAKDRDITVCGRTLSRSTHAGGRRLAKPHDPPCCSKPILVIGVLKGPAVLAFTANLLIPKSNAVKDR